MHTVSFNIVVGYLVTFVCVFEMYTELDICMLIADQTLQHWVSHRVCRGCPQGRFFLVIFKISIRAKTHSLILFRDAAGSYSYAINLLLM